jgi:tripartite ATP-independent transporter DctM subunit
MGMETEETQRARRLRETGVAAQEAGLITQESSAPGAGPTVPGRVYAYCNRVTEVLTVAAVLMELVVIVGNVILRSFFRSPIGWADEAGEATMTIIAFGGAAMAMYRGQMIAMDFVVQRMRSPYRRIAMAAGDWGMIAAAAVLCFAFQGMLQLGLSAIAPGNLPININEFWTEIALPIGVTMFAVNVVGSRMVKYPLSDLLLGLVAAVAGALVIWVLALLNPVGMDVGLALLVAGLTFIVLLVIGQPIAFGFVSAAIVFLVLSQDVGVDAVPTQMWEELQNPVLLAVPFFVWAGFLLTLGGMSQYLARFVIALVGHFRGGLLQVVVVAMYLFSGLSGSKAADIAAVSSALKGIIDEDDASKVRYTAVLNASAVMGTTVPPSTDLIIIGSITGVSILGLFLAGVLPALVLAVCMMVIIYVRARSAGTATTKRASLAKLAVSFGAAIPALTVPVVLIVGILGGFATPTEISGVAVVYAFFAATLVYRKTNMKSVWNLTIDAVSIAGMALFALAAASAFAFVLDIAEVPQDIGGFVASAHVSPILFMLIVAVFLFVMGSVLEGLPCLLVFAPLLLGPAVQLGINPFQFVVVMLIAAQLGVHTPPIGVAYYISCLLTKTSPSKAMRAAWGYGVVIFVGLLIIILVSQITTILPSLSHVPAVVSPT